MINALDLNRRTVITMIAASGLMASTASAQDSGATTVASMVEEFEIGNPDASVTIIEYASFTCPHCANFHRDVFPELKANYIDTGKIRYIYRPVYFDGPGLWADMVARCGGQERFFGIADMIYARQAEWSRGASQAEVGLGLQSIGRLAGLADDDIVACMQDNDHAQALVAAFQENITRDNINATPTFLINGELTSNMSYASFSKILDEQLGE